MKKFFVSVFLASLLLGCTSSTMFLRYTYEPVFAQLPPCSRVVKINNESVTYYLLEGEFSNTTNYYKAFYTIDGKVYKVQHINK
jgi:hypothetical protein